MATRIVTRERGRPPSFDPLQVVAVLAAVYLLVLGIVAVARGGFFTEGATTSVEVGAITATPVLGLGLALVGLVLLWAAGGVEIDDVSIRVVSGLVLVLGIVLLIEPTAFRSILGADRGDGWHHVIVGGIVMVVSFLPPVEQPAAPAADPVDTAPPGDAPPDDDQTTTQRIR